MKELSVEIVGKKLKMSSFRFEFSKDISVVTIHYNNRVYFQRQVISFHNVITKSVIHILHLVKLHISVS